MDANPSPIPIARRAQTPGRRNRSRPRASKALTPGKHDTAIAAASTQSRPAESNRERANNIQTSTPTPNNPTTAIFRIKGDINRKSRNHPLHPV